MTHVKVVEQVISMMQQVDHVPLIASYLHQHVHLNIKVLTDALIQLYLEQLKDKELEQLLQYQHTPLPQLLKMDYIGFRRIGLKQLLKTGKYEDAFQLVQADEMVDIGLNICHACPKMMPKIVQWYKKMERRDCFMALLCLNYQYIKVDMVMEWGWLNGWKEEVMPFMIQYHAEQRVLCIDVEGRDPNQVFDAVNSSSFIRHWRASFIVEKKRVPDVSSNRHKFISLCNCICHYLIHR